MPSDPLHRSFSFDERNSLYQNETDENEFYMQYLKDSSLTPSFSTPQKLTAKEQNSDGPADQAIPINQVPNTGAYSIPKHYVSPYLQKLPHSNFFQGKPPTSETYNLKSSIRQQKPKATKPTRQRSASSTRSRESRLQSACQPSDLEHLDLSSTPSVRSTSSNRPISAPLRVSSATRKKTTPTTKEKKFSKNSAFVINLYRNGDHEKFTYCKVTSFNSIFQHATEKLRLLSAARRLFNEKGEEIYRIEDIQPNRDYFVSSGENFKDPYRIIQSQTESNLNATWTSKGVHLDHTKTKTTKKKTTISKRLDEQIKTGVHVTIIENGFGLDDAVFHILVDSTLKENFETFLEQCTQKLELNGFARKAFNYRGDEIKSLQLFLESEKINMQTDRDGSIVGPIWLSKGEKFRPAGAYLYLQSRRDEFRNSLKRFQEKLQQTIESIEKHKSRTVQNDEETSPNVEMPIREKKSKESHEIISELNARKQEFEEKIKKTKSFIQSYESKMSEIEDEKNNETMLGAKFAIEHIKEISFNDKILGRQPLSLTVHENGTVRETDLTINLNLRNLPSKHSDQTSIEYLLDHLQSSVEIFSRQRPKRIFDIFGNEIKMIGQLKSKQHIFVSYGEDFRPAFEPCLAIQLHSVEVYDVNGKLEMIKAFRPDDHTLTDNEKRSAKQVAAAWKTFDEVPSNIQRINYQRDLDDEKREAFDKLQVKDRVSQQVSFLYKERKLIYPEIQIAQKFTFDGKSKSSSEKTNSKRVFSDQDLQTWLYDRDGCIYNKQFPSLALTVVFEEIIDLNFCVNKDAEKRREDQTSDGFAVQLKLRSSPLVSHQIWNFTPDGFIVSKASEEMALTNLSTVTPENEGKISAQGVRMNEADPFLAFLGVFPKLQQKSALIDRQRWGIRQESQYTIGEWKHSKVQNPLWHRMALTWPVDESGAMIPDLQWPVEGYLIPGVPPIRELKSSQGNLIFVPIRLQILKNGEREQSKAIPVVGPDISNLISEPKSSANIYRRLRVPEPEKEQRTDRKLKRLADARQREMKLFLESCTTLCNLPFAARRLFDSNGTELFDLTSIERDSYVYVTCGEQWIDPELTKAEQQRRLLLAHLTNDVRMMHFYCSLRNPTEYTVSVEQGVTENSSLILTRCSLTSKQRDRVKKGESIEQVIDNEEPVEQIATEPEKITAHERSHRMMDKKEREKDRKPWEANARRSLHVDTDDDDVIMAGGEEMSISESFVTTGDTLSLAKMTKKLPRSVSVLMQRFRWEAIDGYISTFTDPNLVIGAREIEGKVVDVFLKRRNPDDIFQRWNFIPSNVSNHQFATMEQTPFDLNESFFIASKARPTMVLTVSLPAFTGNESNETSVSCVGCSITLQQRREEENGCAHQKWSYDETLGFLLPFNSTFEDKEIMAANRANICSYTVSYEAISQPGYIVSVLNINDQAEDVAVCMACAQSMRGKYRLTKIEVDRRFICAIGKRRDLKFHGPFQCLNHKVDLTRDEAENTLFQRQEQLEQLRQEASVRNIVRELSAAKPIQVIRLLAYRNGDGHTRPGQILVGSSIVGLLDQATRRLNLINAARRLYVIDGSVILTVDDLIQWAHEYYKKCFQQSSKTKMLDRVELETPLPPKNPDSERRSSVDNQSEKTTFSSKLRSISPSKQRFQYVPKAVDLKKAIKQNPSTKNLDVDINYLLKFPIEIWVSAGEPFVNPSEANERQRIRTVQREQRATVEHDLEKEKHILRLMKGRRIFGQSSGELVAQQNPEKPVVKLGHWTETTDAEIFKQDDVNLVKSSLDEILVCQQAETTQPISSIATDRLTQHSRTKRIMVYLNGEQKETAVQCFGSSLDEIKLNAKSKWNLMLPIQVLFDENGQLIERFDQLSRDQYVCVSTTKTFISCSKRQQEVDIKANWARTRNKYGDQATDIRINTNTGSTTQTTVDPFGPPLLILEDRVQQQQQQQQKQNLNHPVSKPPIFPTATNRRLAIQSATPSSNRVIEITSVTPSNKDSLVSSEEDDATDSEIERIINLDNDENNAQATLLPPRIPARPRDAFSSVTADSLDGTLQNNNELLATKSDTEDETDDFIRMLKGK